MPVTHDYHIHTTYSDGSFIQHVIGATADAGLAAIGFAGHCTVSQQLTFVDRRQRYGFSLDLTDERRRRADSEIGPKINSSRLLKDYGEPRPSREFDELDVEPLVRSE